MEEKKIDRVKFLEVKKRVIKINDDLYEMGFSVDDMIQFWDKVFKNWKEQLAKGKD